MTTLDHATDGLHAATRPAFVARVVNAAANAFRAMKNRRAFYRLGEMSDAELADIGLTRSDLHVVVDLPMGEDPTAHLGAIASDRIRRMENIVRMVA